MRGAVLVVGITLWELVRAGLGAAKYLPRYTVANIQGVTQGQIGVRMASHRWSQIKLY